MGLISRVSSRTYRNEINLPNQTFSSPIMARYRVICEPRGFLTILQIIFSLTTIIVLASVAQKISVNLNCKPLSAGTPVDREIIVIVKYPFQFGDIQYESCASNKTLTEEGQEEWLQRFCSLLPEANPGVQGGFRYHGRRQGRSLVFLRHCRCFRLCRQVRLGR